MTAQPFTVDQVRALMKQAGLREPSEAETRALALLDKTWKDPELGPKIRAAAKAQFPDARIPEDDVGPLVAPLQARLEELAKKLEESEKKNAEREAAAAAKEGETTLRQRIDAAAVKFNLTEEGRNAMLDRMKEMGSLDADAAAALIAHNAPKPAIGTKFGPSKINLFGSAEVDEKMKLLHTRPDDFFDAEINALLQDPDEYVRNAA